MTKERSPFTPGRPVPVEFFVGRLPEIDRMVRSVRQVAQGKQENLFLGGERRGQYIFLNNLYRLYMTLQAAGEGTS
ncbi:MAG: hypothetical protein ABIG68_10605 [Acidobacteriota bacterium]